MSNFKNLHSIVALHKVKIDSSIHLVPLARDHSDKLLAILDRDPDIRASVTVASRLYSQKDVMEEIQRYRTDIGLIRYTVLDRHNPIGMISFWRDDGFWGEINPDDYGFGYFLSPEVRGRGIIQRSIAELMKIAMANFYVRQFVAFCEDRNDSSKAVLYRLGFKPTNKTMTEPSKGWVERKYILLNIDQTSQQARAHRNI